MLIANNRNCFLPTLRCRNKVRTYRPKENFYLAVGAKSCTAVVETGRKHTKPIQGLTTSLPLSDDGCVKLATIKPLLQAKRVAVINGARISVHASSNSRASIRGGPVKLYDDVDLWQQYS